MKKLLLLFCSLAFCLPVMAQQNQGISFSPYTRAFLKDAKAALAAGKDTPCATCRTLNDGKRYLPAMLKVSDEAQAEISLRQIGALVGTRAGKVWTAQIPLSEITRISSLQGISYLELGEPAKPGMNMARKASRVDSVHGGYNLPSPYFGDGVLVGVIDFGFDYNHPTFFDTSYNNYRIQKVWELNTTGTPPSGYAFGHEMTSEADIRAQGTDNPEQMHGTATASIAAGGGYAGSAIAGRRFRGVAPASELILVGVRRDTIGEQWLQGTFPDFVDAINYIFTQADAAGKPCVVNISWGSQSGPHDGTSLFNEATNALSGPGKIVVMSAGNEGEEKIHLSKTFSSADSTLATFVTFNNFGDTVYQRTWIDAWGDSSTTLCATVSLWRDGALVSTLPPYCIDDNVTDDFLISTEGDTCYLRFITTTAAHNGRPRMTIDVFNQTTDSVAISFSSTAGKWHIWNEYYFFGYKYGYSSAFDSLGMPWAVSGNTQSTVSDMGSGDSVLLIGAFTSKSGWTDINGNGWTVNSYAPLNQLAPFSSRGPMADGRIKPDITAPGMMLSTATSSYDTSRTATGSNSPYVDARWISPANDTFYYAEFNGTSASAPMAAGIAALMLQIKPDLSVAEMKELLFQTAIKDIFTGPIPAEGNNNWGHGKINAYGAIRQLVASLSVYEYSGNRRLDCVLFPNPNNGHFVLDYQSQKSEMLRVTTVDMAGRLVASFNWEVAPGINRKEMQLPPLPAGTYGVRIAGTDAATLIKFVIK